jgi:hypothetical protein
LLFIPGSAQGAYYFIGKEQAKILSGERTMSKKSLAIGFGAALALVPFTVIAQTDQMAAPAATGLKGRGPAIAESD